MSFCTIINCMDGRVQNQVNEFVNGYFKTKYADTITEAGPNRLLAKETNGVIVENIMHRIKISINKHGSKGIAIVGHHDCAGNPVDKDTQYVHTKKAVQFLNRKFPDLEVLGLWVDEKWRVNKI